MRKRTLLLTAGAVLSAVVFGSAQTQQTITTQPSDGTRIRVTADNYTVTRLWTPRAPSASGGEATWSGNGAIQANGVTILADRVVLKSDDNGDGVEYRVEGNVRVRMMPPTP